MLTADFWSLSSNLGTHRSDSKLFYVFWGLFNAVRLFLNFKFHGGNRYVYRLLYKITYCAAKTQFVGV